MNRYIAALALILMAPVTMADNFATCLLDKMEGVESRAATQAAVRLCVDAHPEQMAGVEQGSGLGWLGKHKSADECIHARTKLLKDQSAVQVVARACDRLYREKPNAPPEPVRRLRPFDGPYDPLPETGERRRLKPFHGEYDPL